MVKELAEKLKNRVFRIEEKLHPFKIPDREDVAVFDSFECDPALLEEFEMMITGVEKFLAMNSTTDLSLAILQYAKIRELKPATVVETGVWHGVSSFVILSALEKNGSGELHSVDMPPFRAGNRVIVGAAVPDSLRHRWHLNIGASLPYLRGAMPECDMFIHDSDHTYRNMLNEFRLAWPKIRPGGVLVSDDVHSNSSICDFARSEKLPLELIRRKKGGYCGLISK